MRVGGGQYKFQILGRFFQGFEHGIEGMPGQHVHLVDHEHLEAPLHWFVHRLLEQLLNFIDTSVGRGIEFGVVDKMPGINIGTSSAHAARLFSDADFAIERFRQNTRHGGLANPPGTRE